MAWLDQSAEQQRRVRELVKLFSQAESRDELGIGQIRDVFSDRLFPGTSVIQTRARYFLFVPWMFTRHEKAGRSGPDVLRRVQDSERRFIAALKAAGEDRGVIGIRAGIGVKILPSAIYWSGLTRYGILTQPLAADEVGAGRSRAEVDPGAADELVVRPTSPWHRELPNPPEGFPDEIQGGFTLTPAEAAWFREIVDASAPGSLLAHLLQSPYAPTGDAPWEDPVVRSVDDKTLALVEDARRFSLVMHGAALLYNLLLAEAYRKCRFNAIEEQADAYGEQLEDWAEHIESDRSALRSWDLPTWWSEVLAHNPRITPNSRKFVTDWMELARSGDLAQIGANKDARTLVANREFSQKKAQSRLRNERLLRTWTGASGARPLTFRWPTVKDLVTDVVNAREVDGASA